MNSYNEDTSFTLLVELYDEDREALTPQTARYRIECLTSKSSIRSWTTLSAGPVLTIPVEPDDNVIVNERNRVERRQLTIQTDYDTTSQRVFTREWDVRNLQG